MSDERSRTLRFELTVGLAIDDAFDYFSDVARLNEVTPTWFRLDADGGVPTRLDVGSRIDYRFTWRRLPMRWRSRITVWEPPRYFVYEQERGPYRSFRHVHIFEPVFGGTRVVDLVTYRTAFGELVDRRIVEPELARVFDYRRTYAERRFPVPRAVPDSHDTGSAKPTMSRGLEAHAR